MPRLIAYGAFTRVAGLEDGLVLVNQTQLHQFLRSILPEVEVNEDFYRKTYRDVNEAILDGRTSSASEHYVAVGYFEGRRPRAVLVDEQWYLSVYPDVATAVKQGKVENAQSHFDNEGFKEGRLPHDDWTL
jgi:hypothetical protein